LTPTLRRPTPLSVSLLHVLMTVAVFVRVSSLQAQDPVLSADAAVAAPEASLTSRLNAARESLERATGVGDEAKVRSAASLVEILEASVAAETRRTGYEKAVDTAEAERVSAQQRLADAESAAALDPIGPKPGSDLAAVRARMTELQRRADELAAEADGITSSLARREIRRAAMRTESTEIAERLAFNEAATGSELDHREARIERRRLEALALDAERRSYDATDDILRQRQRANAREKEALQTTLTLWQTRLTELESRDAELRRRAAAAAARAQSDPIAKAVAARNRELADRLSALSSGEERLADTLATQTGLLERVRRGLESDRRRFAGRVTPAIATVLRQRDAALPSEVELRQQIARLRMQLPEIEVERLVLEDELSQLANAAAEADRLIRTSKTPVPEDERPELRRTLMQLLDTRVVEYGQPLLRVLNTRADELNAIVETDRKLLDEIEAYRDFVLQQTVWVRDPDALNAGLLSRITEQAGVFFSLDGWRSIVRAGLSELRQRPFLAAFAVGPGLLLLLFRRPIRRRIELAGDRVARAATDRFRESLLVAFFAVIQGVAFAAPFWALGIAFGNDPLGSPMVLALDHTLVPLGSFVFVLATIGATTRHGGLAERHFHWSPAILRLGRRFVRLSVVAVAFATCDRMCDPRELALPDLGRLFYTPIPLLIATVLVLAIRTREEQGPGSGLHVPSGSMARWILGLSIVLPVSAAILANLGWYDATAMLQRATVASLLYLASLVLLRDLLFRGLNSHQRQESWRLRRQREEGEDVADEVEDLADVGARTRAAIRFCTIGLLLLGVWIIWHDLLPAFQSVRDIPLWTHEAMVPVGEDGRLETTIVPVTLGALLLSVGMFIATFAGSRHLPTLLEIGVLDRLGLERGVRYAVVQLVQWVVVISGSLVAFSLIGITWASVQWLAAGFTVGLGFGMQEIFANFISGLIILFEQPVRVGDVVTVGATTGRISRVRMRSTTITDWDRKELIVPNKQFITQEVVNWSIGDSCIRVVLPVGVSYGDDPETVSSILTEVGRQDPETLADPEPHVAFTGFGDSSLNFELRVFLAGTDGLITVRNRLNTAIKKAFDAAGVSIPFPQRDVHVSMVSRQDPEGGPQAPLPAPPPEPGLADGSAS
jgi:potassium efflux system protein